MDHGIAFKSVPRRQHHSARAPSPLRHRLNHHVDVPGMIEMLVRKNDRVEMSRLARWYVRERAHERTGTGIDVNLRVTEVPPHSARRANLPRDDEARAAGAEEQNGSGQRAPSRGLRIDTPMYAMS